MRLFLLLPLLLGFSVPAIAGGTDGHGSVTHDSDDNFIPFGKIHSHRSSSGSYEHDHERENDH